MQAELNIFYDGLCPLCSREIGHYRGLPGSEKLRFVDITSPDFDAKNEGLDPVQVHKVMHVRTADGKIKTRVDAFVEIWRYLPKYQKLIPLAENKLIRPFLNFGYEVFARVIRPILPKNKDCNQSPYCEK